MLFRYLVLPRFHFILKKTVVLENLRCCSRQIRVFNCNTLRLTEGKKNLTVSVRVGLKITYLQIVGVLPLLLLLGLLFVLLEDVIVAVGVEGPLLKPLVLKILLLVPLLIMLLLETLEADIPVKARFLDSRGLQ